MIGIIYYLGHDFIGVYTLNFCVPKLRNENQSEDYKKHTGYE